jgi:hypothetical protein
MILDGALQFTGTAGAVNVDTPTTGTQQSTNVLDLLNARDMGIGDDPALKVLILVTATFTVGTSLEVQIQGAPDDGTGNPGSYTTMITTGTLLEAVLVVGRLLLAIDLPRILLPTELAATAAQALPRFLRLQYVTAGTHSTGTLFGALVLDRQDQISYPPGITINN